jgi:hypothetical protein
MTPPALSSQPTDGVDERIEVNGPVVSDENGGVVDLVAV